MKLKLRDPEDSNYKDLQVEDSIKLIINTLDTVGDDADIINSFNDSFQNVATIQTKEQLASAIMMSQEIRDWYLKFTESRTSSLSKPEWLPSDQQGLDDWIEMQSKLEAHQRRVNEWNRGIRNAISDLRKRITRTRNSERKA